MGRPPKGGKTTKRSAATTRPTRQVADVTSARRAEVIAAATRLFVRKGIGNTTMRDIADEVGILNGSLYYYFPSKDTLVDEIVRGAMNDVINRYIQIRDADLDPLEALTRLITVELRTAVGEHRDATSIVQNDHLYLSGTDAFAWVEDMRTQSRYIWREVLQRCIAAGVMRDIDLDVAYFAVTGLILSSVRWYRPNNPLSLDELVETLVGVLLRGLQTR
jgi:AcrR family transcriptional regulator